MKNVKKTDLIATLIVAVMLLAFSITAGGLFKAQSVSEVMHRLCDAFTAPGIVLVCVGALSWASSKGAYDIFGYGVKVVWGWFPFTSTNMDNVSYYDYVAEKNEARKAVRVDMLIVGAICLALALVFLTIYLIM